MTIDEARANPEIMRIAEQVAAETRSDVWYCLSAIVNVINHPEFGTSRGYTGTSAKLTAYLPKSAWKEPSDGK